MKEVEKKDGSEGPKSGGTDAISGGVMPDDDGCIPNPWEPPMTDYPGNPAGPVNPLPRRSPFE